MKKLAYSLDGNSLVAVENASDYVDARVLTAGIAETLTKPANARFVRLSSGAIFYYNSNGTAAVPATDIANGSSSVAVPATIQPKFCVDDVTAISVIAAAAGVVTAEWWG